MEKWKDLESLLNINYFSIRQMLPHSNPQFQFHSGSPKQGGIPDSSLPGRWSPIHYSLSHFPPLVNQQYLSIKGLVEYQLHPSVQNLTTDKLFESHDSPMRLQSWEKIFWMQSKMLLFCSRQGASFSDPWSLGAHSLG